MTLAKLYISIMNVLTNKRGAAMVEYALLAALIAVVATAALTSLGTNISSKFSAIASSL